MRPPKPLSDPLAAPLARFGLGAALGLAALVAPRAACAQAVTNIVGTVTRVEADGTTSAEIAHAHPGGVPINDVNYYDCEANLQYKFELALTGGSTSADAPYQLVAYAGATDCTAAAARIATTSSSPTCWAVTPQALSQTSPTTVLVRVQDLAAQAPLATVNPAYPAADSSACTAQTTDTGNGLVIYFFFIDKNGNAIGVAQPYPILVDTQAATPSAITVTAGTADRTLVVGFDGTTDPDVTGWTLLCNPPPGVSADASTTSYVPPANNACVDAAGDSAETGPDANATDANGNDAQGIDGANDAAGEAGDDGAAPDAGDEDGGTDAGADGGDAASATPIASDAGSDAEAGATTPVSPIDDAGGNSCGIPTNDADIPTGGSCVTTPFQATAVTGVAAADADADGAAAATPTRGLPQTPGSIVGTYECATGAATDTSITVSGLSDKVDYAVALAATDAVGNVGPLVTGCNTPVALYDFYDAYQDANGHAGGGFCEADGVGVPAGTSALGVLFSAACAALVRRRRRRS